MLFTSDHGELGGSHGGLRGKGPTPYEECIHIPMLIVHPDAAGGQDCQALTSHIDLAPTLLSLAGVSGGQVSEFAGRDLPGADLTTLLTSPGSADARAVRDGALFSYSGLAMVDSDPLQTAAQLMERGMAFSEALAAAGKPNLMKRGTVRTMVDGRYKFSRYFSPLQHNTPGTLEELYQYNDLELFDLENDPAETLNLALERQQHAELIAAMNDRLTRLIDAEMGQDNGRELPDVEGIRWELRASGTALVLD